MEADLLSLKIYTISLLLYLKNTWVSKTIQVWLFQISKNSLFSTMTLIGHFAGLAAGLGGPRLVLTFGEGSWGPASPGAGAGLLVGDAGLKATAALLMSRVVSQGLWLQGPGSGLGPVHWCVGPSAGPSGRPDYVQGAAMGSQS